MHSYTRGDTSLIPLMNIIRASDASLLILFGETISPEVHHQVIALFRSLQSEADPRIRNLHPAYASLLIDFDPLRWTHDELAAHITQLTTTSMPAGELQNPIVSIPVCYCEEFGLDLIDVATQHKLSVDEVIRLHASATYLVYFLGFSPGFAYMGGLPEALHTPRLTTPRKFVKAGSVGIAGSQTGVYPVDSPGGWRLLGRTPVRMFDPDATPPTRLQPGDRVKFSPIDRASFEHIAQDN